MLCHVVFRLRLFSFFCAIFSCVGDCFHHRYTSCCFSFFYFVATIVILRVSFVVLLFFSSFASSPACYVRCDYCRATRCDYCHSTRLFVLVFMAEAFLQKVRVPPPFPVTEYIASISNKLDAKRFSAMCDDGSVEWLPDNNGIKRLADSSCLGKLWNHWGDSSYLTSIFPNGNLEIPYIRAK